ncbi:arsenate reductase (glutaredoxin) [Flavobacterium sp. RHBU_3]|uniref:arsenate reductase (glutaredoxin) n=1 Tax=Flavobacterium sp. RHBU_3 TaxID=3391184 RepID=UPI003984DF10
MLTIYHNPRCGKSREGLQLIENLNLPFTTINYIKEPLTQNELTALIKKLGIAPIDLVRTKEALWKEQYKDKNLTDDEILQALAQNPVLIERPIVVNANKAVIARPAERIHEIL